MNKNFLHKLVRYLAAPYDRDGDPAEYKRVVLAIYVILLGGAGSVFFLFLDLQLGVAFYYISDLSLLCSCIYAIYMIRKGRMAVARGFFFTIVVVNWVLSSSAQGREVGNQMLVFPLICSVFLLFPLAERKTIIFFVTLFVVSLIYLELTDYSALKGYATPEQLTYPYYLLTLIFSISLFLVLVYKLVKENEASESQFKWLNKSLAQKNEELNKANKELDSFVYRASHDLRSPLTTMLGLINISRAEKDPVKRDTYLGLQESMIHKLDKFILNILDLSRNSRVEMRYELIDFNQLIDEAFNHHLTAFARERLVSNIQIKQKGTFWCDRERILIIFNNLISNSLKYYDPSKKNIELDILVSVSKSIAHIEISDNGIGINTDQHEKVFEMFYRATQYANGSGLGLYIVKETIDKLHGTIQLSSEYGKGTQIVLELPNMLRKHAPLGDLVLED